MTLLGRWFKRKELQQIVQLNQRVEYWRRAALATEKGRWEERSALYCELDWWRSICTDVTSSNVGLQRKVDGLTVTVGALSALCRIYADRLAHAPGAGKKR